MKSLNNFIQNVSSKCYEFNKELSKKERRLFLDFFAVCGQNYWLFSFIYLFADSLTGIIAAVPCPLRAPLVVTIVGPPCRGKSLAAHKIARFLVWKGEFAKGLFNFLIIFIRESFCL